MADTNPVQKRMIGARKPVAKGYLVVLVILVVVGLGSFGGYWFYEQHHISSDLKRTILAALDSHSTENDFHVYMREARLQVRTRRDAIVLAKLENAAELANSSAEIWVRQYRESLDSLRNPKTPSSRKLEDIKRQYRQSHIAVPKSIEDHIQEAYRQEKAEWEQEKQTHYSEANRAKTESETAQKLLQEVRVAVGSPPPKESKPEGWTNDPCPSGFRWVNHGTSGACENK